MIKVNQTATHPLLNGPNCDTWLFQFNDNFIKFCYDQSKLSLQAQNKFIPYTVCDDILSVFSDISSYPGFNTLRNEGLTTNVFVEYSSICLDFLRQYTIKNFNLLHALFPAVDVSQHKSMLDVIIVHISKELDRYTYAILKTNLTSRYTTFIQKLHSRFTLIFTLIYFDTPAFLKQKPTVVASVRQSLHIFQRNDRRTQEAIIEATMSYIIHITSMLDLSLYYSKIMSTREGKRVGKKRIPTLITMNLLHQFISFSTTQALSEIKIYLDSLSLGDMIFEPNTNVNDKDILSYPSHVQFLCIIKHFLGLQTVIIKPSETFMGSNFSPDWFDFIHLSPPNFPFYQKDEQSCIQNIFEYLFRSLRVGSLSFTFTKHPFTQMDIGSDIPFMSQDNSSLYDTSVPSVHEARDNISSPSNERKSIADNNALAPLTYEPTDFVQPPIDDSTSTPAVVTNQSSTNTSTSLVNQGSDIAMIEQSTTTTTLPTRVNMDDVFSSSDELSIQLRTKPNTKSHTVTRHVNDTSRTRSSDDTEGRGTKRKSKKTKRNSSESEDELDRNVEPSYKSNSFDELSSLFDKLNVSTILNEDLKKNVSTLEEIAETLSEIDTSTMKELKFKQLCALSVHKLAQLNLSFLLNQTETSDSTVNMYIDKSMNALEALQNILPAPTALSVNYSHDDHICGVDGPCSSGETCINIASSIECDNENCLAKNKCLNRRMSRGRSFWKNVTVTEVGVRGKGLIASEDIKDGEFVLEYTGYVTENHSDSDYVLQVHAGRYIDADVRRNPDYLAGYINHSHSPNLMASTWRVGKDDRVALFAIQDIPKGTELSFNYGQYYHKGTTKHYCHCKAIGCPLFY